MAGQRETWQCRRLFRVLCVALIFCKCYIGCEAATATAGAVHPLLITTDNYIWKISVNRSVTPSVNSNPTRLISGCDSNTAVAVDNLRGRVYWSDRGKHTISRAALDGSNQEVIVIAAYLGCFRDYPNYEILPTHLPDRRSDNTPLSCVRVCHNQSYAIAGVKNGYSCYCGRSIGNAVREPETDCNKTCPGDRSLMCGGELRLSIYDTRPLVVHGLAVDTVNNQIYFTNKAAVERMNPDSKERTRLYEHSGNRRKTYGIAVDIADRMLFHSTRHPARVFKSRLDGTETVEIISSGLRMPWGMAVDYNYSRICFADYEKKCITCTEYNGRNPKQVNTTGNVLQVAIIPISNVNDDSLYYTQNNPNSVYSCRLNLTGCHVIPSGSLETSGIAVLNDNGFNGCLSDPCRNGGTCEKDDGSYNCHCWPSYTGILCETMQCTCQDELSVNGHYCVLRPLTTFPLNISCEMNCRTPASSREKLALIAKCDDCAVSSNYSYTWHVNPDINWLEDTGTGRNARTLIVNANVLSVNQGYSFSVTVRDEPCSRREANATHVMRTVTPPTRGNCSIEPDVGVASKTVFYVTCEGFYDSYQPLTFIFFFKIGNGNSKVTVLLGSSNETSFRKTLPVGNVKKNYNATIEVRVQSCVGETTYVDVPVTVLPLPQLKETSLDEIFDMVKLGGQRFIQQFLAGGRIQDALSFITSAASAVRHASTVVRRRSMERERTELNTKLVFILKLVNVTDVTGVNMKLQCLNDVTDMEDELSYEAKNDAVNMYEDMAGFLLRTTETPDNTDALSKTSALMDKATTAVFVGIANIAQKTMSGADMIEVATGTTEEIEDSYTMKKKAVVRSIINKTMRVINVVSQVVLSRQIPGEKETILKSGIFALGLRKDSAYHLSNMHVALPTSGHRVIKLPTLHGTGLTSSAADNLCVKVFQSSVNMYTWDASSRNVTTGLVALTITSDNKQRTNIAHFTDPLLVSVPVAYVDTPTYIAIDVDVEADTVGNRDIVHFTSHIETYKMFHITFALPAREPRSTLLLVLKTDTYARMTDFFGEDDNATLLVQLEFADGRRTKIVSTSGHLGHNTVVTESYNGMVVVSGIVTQSSARRLFLGLLPAFYDSVRCRKCKTKSIFCGFCTEMSVSRKYHYSNPHLANVRVTTKILDCLYWEPSRQIWTNSACKVSLKIKPGYIVCECSHLSTFAGNVLVAPNKVDLFELKLFLGIYHNPIVVSLLIAIWCLFVIMTVWARRKDGTRPVKAELAYLADNDDDSNYYYLVTVLTGWKNGGGTTSAVALCIAGTWACTRVHVMYEPDRFMLETGSEKWFLLATKQSLGELRKLTVWHSSSGLFPNWFLNQITVRDVQTDERWHFVCNDWLTPERGIRNIRRTLFVHNKANLGYRFELKATQIVRDQHLWLSIFCPPAHSVFTRVQRVACAMSFITVGMVSTIMFYGQHNSDDEFDFAKGGFHISREQFVIGIECLLISSPFNVFIVAIFRHVRPRRKSVQVHPRETHREASFYNIDDDNQEKQTHRKSQSMKEKLWGAWWHYYVAWFLAISSSLVATYITAMYSMTYGYSASVSWTVSFFSTFFEEVVIIQPLKVTTWAALFSVLFESDVGPATPADYYVNLVKDPKELSRVKRIYMFKKLPLRCTYSLPNPVVVERASRRLGKEHKMWRTLLDTAIGVLLFTLLFIIAYGNVDHRSFYINKSILDTFVNSRHSGNVTFTQIKTRDDVWQYIKYTLLPAFYYNGTTFISDETNVLIGSAIIRQIRTDSRSHQYKGTYDTTSYKRAWTKPITDDLMTNPYSAWTYQSTHTLQIGPLQGLHRTYPGGGYVVAIRPNSKRMMRLLQDLEDAHWLNNNTRAVLVQFTTFNPTTSLFTISLLAFEFMNVGVVEPYHDINTCKLYSFKNMRDAFTIICEICYLVLILLYINRAFRSFLAARTHLKQYLLSVWTYVDCVIIVLVYAAVVVFIIRTKVINDVVSSSLKHRRRFVNFKKAVSYESIFSYILAASITMIAIKTINLLYVSRRALVQTSRLKRNIKYISIYAACIVLTIALVLTVLNVLYGASCNDHSHASTSIMATVRMILFKLNHDDKDCIMGWSLVDFLFHGVVTFVLLPWMILLVFSLVVITTSCNYHCAHLQEKTEFIDFLFSRLLLMLGFWNINEYTEHMKITKH